MSSAENNAPVLPEVFGPYRIVRPLGKGGMGTVFLARDTRLDRDVALKVCHLSDDPRAQARFRREAKAAASLRHPNLCPVYEFDVRDGIAYLTMAFIEGPTLDVWVAKRGRLTQRDAALLVAKLALALQEVHDRGIVHRDLKPENVIIGRHGEPVVLDFGLARQLDESATRLTQVGAIYGTPKYMAPEQAGDDPSTVGPAADVYALGVILYELLTGVVPFSGPPMVRLFHTINTPPIPPRQRNAAVDATLEAICLCTLAKQPEDRPRSMKDLAEALTVIAGALPGPAGTPVFGPQPTPPAIPGTLPVSSPEETLRPTGTIVNTLGMTLVYVRPDTFLMGSPETEHGRWTDETPHRVTLTQGFYLGATLVTQNQWTAVMGKDNNPSQFKGDDLPVDLPVEGVSWKDAKEFCARLSKKEGRQYRLPTEAEWEYAARAGTTTPFWQGETITTDQANFEGSDSYRDTDPRSDLHKKTTPVMYFRPNPWGLYDMGGNLWQWCEDWYGDYPAAHVTDPTGSRSGEHRVLRGGSWYNGARNCRAATRLGHDPEERGGVCFGFRVVLSGGTVTP